MMFDFGIVPVVGQWEDFARVFRQRVRFREGADGEAWCLIASVPYEQVDVSAGVWEQLHIHDQGVMIARGSKHSGVEVRVIP